MSRMKQGVSSGNANNSIARSDSCFCISMIRELQQIKEVKLWYYYYYTYYKSLSTPLIITTNRNMQ